MPRPAQVVLKSGFTLVEMLVVIGIISLLVGLIVPAMASFRASTKSSHCLQNLRQIHMAIETARQQKQDMLPFAAPLPLPAGQLAVVPGLPQRLQAIMPADAETWMCPADETGDSEALGTSFLYVPGAFMLLEPPLISGASDPSEPPPPLLSESANIERVTRLITQRFMNGYLHSLPLVADSGDYHDFGNRQPRNALFIDGEARVMKPNDSDVAQPPP